MAPVAARLSLGLDPAQLGPPLETLDRARLAQAARCSRTGSTARCSKIDSFGNLITNITADMLAGRPTDDRACVVCGIYETWGIYRTYADQAAGMLIALVGSTGGWNWPSSAATPPRRLGIAVGTPVVVAWE